MGTVTPISSVASALPAAVEAARPGRHSVFVYGSLMADELVRLLLQRIPSSSPAVLHHYRRFSIKGRVYPAIIPLEGEKVQGKVLFGITDPELDILDTFEDTEYERSVVEVTTESLEKLNAYAYVWINKSDPDLHGTWDFDDWKPLHLKDFLQMTVDYLEELKRPECRTRVAACEDYFNDHDL